LIERLAVVIQDYLLFFITLSDFLIALARSTKPNGNNYIILRIGWLQLAFTSPYLDSSSEARALFLMP
jgi:hypothetical protein